MRNLLMALVVVGLLAAPSLGVVNIKLTADKTVLNNTGTDSAVITLWGQGDVAGLFSVAGNITATGASVLGVPATGINWVVDFNPTFGLVSKPGVPGANGTVTQWGSEQTQYLSPNNTYGKADYVAVGSYTVVAGTATGQVTLNVAPMTVGGYKPCETNKATAVGTVTGVTITVTPEPVTMALLALGGLLVARRRR